MSTGPSSFSIFEMWPSIWVRSARSHFRPRFLVPMAVSADCAAAIESVPMPATAMFVPSRARDSAIARPRPPPPPNTRAVLFFRPKSMGSFYLGFVGGACLPITLVVKGGRQPVQVRGIPHLAKNQRDVGTRRLSRGQGLDPNHLHTVLYFQASDWKRAI